MAGPRKNCPKCGAENFNTASTCTADGCDHVFFKKKARRKKAEPPGGKMAAMDALGNTG